ncbi:MAG: 3-deoxy-manno-octulosonate cytidylyltransferase [Bdellovibrionales bacterium RIFCSPHIGHO2_01_FULL_40_29]|nr:MAG: 3-deoxy-manno-octulosonate cytidylyltransferase [Bdellovibrionales bacterium RIFCSPHIGHO2_01_FULL_40_29]OFZ35479.1 MAG: 3-deoxy-manno-octulosonate cytidylyltransferase [Bdellovibrionales bacterium RIFCSPHIGHO2_02_FULL_40_15]
MKIIGIIPARFASTRFPGKPLAELRGKKILQWVVEGARTSLLLSEIHVATDDQRIFDFCQSIGASAIMTSTDCVTGTDRICEATRHLDFDYVINIQGDEPLVNKDYIDPLAKAFVENQSLEMVTLAHPFEAEDLNNMNAVKVITNQNDEAIYFSRFPIPFSREGFVPGIVQKHIGLYGYSRKFLQTFCTTPQTQIEKFESLEQLRALYLGARIKVISVSKPTYGVDTPEDLQKLEALLK